MSIKREKMKYKMDKNVIYYDIEPIEQLKLVEYTQINTFEVEGKH